MDNSSDLFPEGDKTSFEAAFAWWEKRRLRYNMMVGIPGVFVMLVNVLNDIKILNPLSIAFIICFAIAANACYCLGYLLEFFLKYYFRSGIDFVDKRQNFYWIGTAFSVFVVIAGGLLELFTQPVYTNFIHQP